MTCAKCGGELYGDRRSVADAEAEGWQGGRIYCLQGCTDTWVLRRLLRLSESIPAKAPKLIGPASFTRPLRTFCCIKCGTPAETRGSQAKYCPLCRDEVHRERERTRTRRDRKKVAA